ncbi:tyrosine-type recombinase/integrase [Streptomyces collinus]|uniref:tyrosine-type recombinase/integrase n=1 Tax=Streptomyces collinus TaxID=42684 RepID=UPI003D43B31D
MASDVLGVSRVKARKAAGVTAELYFHDLRHTGNTLASTAGASTRELMTRMGHSSSRAALIYQHMTSDRDRAIADRLGAMTREPRRASSWEETPCELALLSVLDLPLDSQFSSNSPSACYFGATRWAKLQDADRGGPGGRSALQAGREPEPEWLVVLVA